MVKYLVAERIIRCKLPYNGRKEMFEGYVIFDRETNTVVSDLIVNKDEANNKANEMNKNEEKA